MVAHLREEAPVFKPIMLVSLLRVKVKHLSRPIVMDVWLPESMPVLLISPRLIGIARRVHLRLSTRRSWVLAAALSVDRRVLLGVPVLFSVRLSIFVVVSLPLRGILVTLLVAPLPTRLRVFAVAVVVVLLIVVTHLACVSTVKIRTRPASNLP